MDGVIRKKDGFEHFRAGLAIDDNAGFNGLLKLDRLLDGDESADAHIGQALDSLNYDFDIFTLLVGGSKQVEIA